MTDAFDKARPAPRQLVFFGQKFGYAMNAQWTELFDVSLQMAEMYATPQPTAAPAAFPAEPTATAAPAGV